MYIYFDSQGRLKEIITENAFRQGDSDRDEIYIFVENLGSPNAGFVSYGLPNGERTEETQFFVSGSSTLKLVGKALPTKPLRNLRYFSYDHTYEDATGTHVGYQFYKIVVPDEVLGSSQEYSRPNVPTENNLVVASIRFIFSDNILKIGDLPFSVETSRGILTDYKIDVSQYNYIIKVLSQIYSEYAPLVPANDNTLDFGSDAHNYRKIKAKAVESNSHLDLKSSVNGEVRIYGHDQNKFAGIRTDNLSEPRHYTFPDKDCRLADADEIPDITRLAEGYIVGRSYSKDDVVLHDGTFYRAKANFTAGSWDLSQWQELTFDYIIGLATPDATLDGNSERAIQNKAVVNALNGKVDKTTTVNSKPLDDDVVLEPEDLGMNDVTTQEIDSMFN